MSHLVDALFHLVKKHFNSNNPYIAKNVFYSSNPQRKIQSILVNK